MIIANPVVRYRRTIADNAIGDASQTLLVGAEEDTREYFKGAGTSIEVRVEQGTVTVWLIVSASIQVLVQYGNLRQSLDYLVKDARALGRQASSIVRHALSWSEDSIEYRRIRSGVPGRLRRLFQGVEAGEVEPAEATQRAIAIIQHAERQPVPLELARQFGEEFDAAYRTSASINRTRPKRRRRKAQKEPKVVRARKRRGAVATRNNKGQITVREYTTE